MRIMSTTSVGNSLASSLSTFIQEAQGQSSTTGSSNLLSALESSLGTQRSDNSQLSPLAEVLSTLQQLQQSNPTEYSQVTSQISTNLQNAAQTATSDGNTTAAAQLTQLAKDFESASTSGQLPNIQDLAQAIGGGGHHHHHHARAAAGSDNTSNSGSNAGETSNSTSNQALSQLLSALQTNGSSQSTSLNPLSIIFQTLSGPGTGGSNS